MNPVYMHAFKETIHNCTERARIGKNIITLFGNDAIPLLETNTNLNANDNTYLPAVLGQCPNAINKKRILSKGEISNRFRYQNGAKKKTEHIYYDT